MKKLFYILLICFPVTLLGQKQVTVLQADFLEYNNKIADGAQRLVGYVVLDLDDVTLSCDSAYIYENQNFEAFSNVHINQGDSIHLYGDYLTYSHRKREANLEKNAMFKDNDMTLKTDFITYDLNSSIGSYLGGGVINSTKNKNRLSSQIGTYDSENEMFFFKNDVNLQNPDYSVVSDTLNYSNASEVAFFFGPTTISGENSEIYCENGWYNTTSEICQFSKNASVTSESRVLKGDSIFYNGTQEYGEAFRNVSIADSADNFTITGNYGFHDQVKDSSFVVGKALFIQGFDTDSLFLHADTLLAVKDTSSNIIKAFHGVEFFKTDLQGKSDSLIWLNKDSLLHMYYEPIIWNQESQMTADTITISMKNGKIDQLFARERALLISHKGAQKYDQIKGRSLTGIFKDDDLETLHVNGNGQAVYYITEETDSLTKISGLNKIDCSDIVIYMENQDISRISFLNSPKGAMLPIKQAVLADEKLEGFIWRETERPASQKDLLKD